MLLDPVVNETVTILGTCGVCEREIAVQDGKLVHHGYRRPGDGQIHGDCFAVGYEPYERSTEASVAYQKMVAASIPGMQARLSRLLDGKVASFKEFDHWKRQVVYYAVGVTELYAWVQQVQAKIHEVEGRIRMAEFEVARMDKLVAAFELRPLGSESRAGEKVRKEKEARAAERAAKKAVRDEKTRKLAEKKAAVASKTKDVEVRFLAELERLVDTADATDERASYKLRCAAEELCARFTRECKKAPRVSISLYDLERADLFVRAGLATRDREGYVSYRVYRLGT